MIFKLDTSLKRSKTKNGYILYYDDDDEEGEDKQPNMVSNYEYTQVFLLYRKKKYN